MRSLINAICGGASMAALLLGAGNAVAGGIDVPINEVRIVSFPTAISTVFMGNPSIADVTVIDPHRVFIMGKVFGSTNLIGLDSNGHPAVSERVTVFGKTAGMVTVHHGAVQMTYACGGGRCEASPVPGDDRGTYFDPVFDERDKTSGQALAAAGQNGH